MHSVVEVTMTASVLGMFLVLIQCGCFRSFFQSVCVLGYCLLAPAIALGLCRAVLLVGRSTTLFLVRLLIGIAAFVWSTASCMIFLGESQAQGRKVLAGYPVCLFYAVISWLVISHTE